MTEKQASDLLSRPLPTPRGSGGDARGRGPMPGWSIARLWGVDIRLDVSLVFIFLLITVTLAAGTFPAWHPEWTPLGSWVVGVVAAIAFLASVVAHELSHAVVGRALGIPVQAITLFLFGGLASMSKEASSPRDELLMTLAGPATSLVIGLLAVGGLAALAPPMDQMASNPEAFVQGLSPVATLLLWLGPINILLAVFNLIPGFPLDGGRVLRALLWWASGDRLRATRWASRIGEGVGILFVLSGLYMVLGGTLPFLGRGFLGGLWILLIGWFLSAAARRSYGHLVTSQLLETTPVRKIITTDVERVPADMTVAQLVEGPAMRTQQNSFPVDDDGQMAGIVSLDAVRRTKQDEWSRRTVGEMAVAIPAEDMVGIDSDAAQALRTVAAHEVDQLPVVGPAGHVLGFVRERDILRWLYLHEGASAA